MREYYAELICLVVTRDHVESKGFLPNELKEKIVASGTFKAENDAEAKKLVKGQLKSMRRAGYPVRIGKLCLSSELEAHTE